MQNQGEYFDVIVLGGGPGGSTLASFTAMQGHRVVLFERDKFPRHQIGESLLPATVHGICRLLGVSDELARQNFPVKRGGTFRWGKNEAPWTFTFALAPNSPTGTAYQVERSKFDAILLNNARSKGVDVREQHTATEFIVEDGRVVGVRYLDANGRPATARARYVVDCGGNRSTFHRHCGERIFSKFFRNVALYCYFENGRRLPPPNSGNILSVAFSDGWFWYIPLSDTLTSVGAVVSRDAAERMSDPDSAMRHYIDQAPLIKEYLSGATRVTSGIYGEYRIRKDYSYCNTSFWKPGCALVGDAACFIDPVFSSGVHLSTYSALLAARTINTCLRNSGIDEAVCFDEFEQRYRREFGNFYQFLIGFYDMHVDEDSYFWRARKIVNTEERDNVAFVRLVAGLSSLDEPIFGGGEEFFESRVGFGEWFEKTTVERGGASAVPGNGRRIELDRSRFDPDKFMQGFTAELTQIQLQALLGKERGRERPLFEHNLVPSPDGLHWVAAS